MPWARIRAAQEVAGFAFQKTRETTADGSGRFRIEALPRTRIDIVAASELATSETKKVDLAGGDRSVETARAFERAMHADNVLEWFARRVLATPVFYGIVLPAYFALLRAVVRGVRGVRHPAAGAGPDGIAPELLEHAATRRDRVVARRRQTRAGVAGALFIFASTTMPNCLAPLVLALT